MELDARGRYRMLLLFLISPFISFAAAFNEGWTIPIEHSFGDSKSFESRGQIEIGKARPGTSVRAVYIPGPSLSGEERRKLAEGAVGGGRYFLRAPHSLNEKTIQGNNFVMSSTDMCRLLKSELNEVISLSIDSSSQKIMSIAPLPVVDLREDYPLTCGEDTASIISTHMVFDNFNTTIRVVDIVDGPTPDAQAFIQRREQERQERARGEQPDNRHWLAKYWMYIVPVVLLMMLSSGMNQEQQGGGGGGR